MDHPTPTAQSIPLLFPSAHPPAEVAAALGDCRLEPARGGSGRVRRQRLRARGVCRRLVLLAALAAASAGSTPASAADGLLEINQTCAVQTGCFAGDTAGFPVTITASGSYRLTSNLVVPNENTAGIQVATDNISIDLAGFEIRGPVVCSGTPLACTPSSGTGSGVQRTLATLSGISLRNGSIRGMGGNGAILGVQSEVTNVRARWNRVDGIRTDIGSTVLGNTAYQNGGDGIQTSTGSTVSGNTTYQNASIGIQAGTGSTVSGNTVRLNTGFGLNLGAESGYRENVISSNTAGTVNGVVLVNLGSNACNGNTICP